ncbi:MAG: leucine-rich repeat protein [Bacillota bacterium]
MARHKKTAKCIIFIFIIALAVFTIAGCTTERVRILFDSEGGTDLDPLILDPDADFVVLPNPPQKTGYEFAGWYTNEEKTTSFNANNVPSETITLYADWVPMDLVITFRASTIDDPTYEYIYRTIPYGSSLQNDMPPVPERTGYEGVWDFDDVNIHHITESYIIDAVYTSRPFDMTFITDAEQEPDIVSEYMDEPYDIPDDPTREGYYFGGWYSDSNYNTPYIFPEVMPARDVTLYAWWVKETDIIDYYLYERVDYDGGTDNAIRIIDITRAAIYLSNMLIPSEIEGLPVKYIGYDTPYEQVINEQTQDDHIVFNTSSLENIFISNTIDYIGSMAFAEASELTTIRFENDSKLKKISDAAFINCSRIEQISLPSSLQTIGNYAFAEKERTDGRDMMLSYVGIKDDAELTSIGEGAFSGCARLQQFFIPSSLVSIDYLSFQDASIREFTVASDHEYYTDNDGIVFSLDNETLIYFPNRGGISRGTDDFGNMLFEYVVPMTTRFIGPNAFRGNSHLTSVAITTMVESINDYAFYDMPNLENLTFTTDSQIQTIGNYAFSGARKVESIILPEETLLSIGNSAFSSIDDEPMGLEQINLTEGLFSIGENAFKNCVTLMDVTIPSTVQTIGDNAFYNCNQLIVDFNTSNSNLTSIGDYAFYKNYSIRDIILPASLVTIGDYAFAAEEDDDLSMQLTTLILDIDSQGNRHLEEIGEGAFANCSSLLTFSVSERVDYIGPKAFYNCSSLRVTFSGFNNEIQKIEPYTFYKNTNLVNINLPLTIEEIGEYAFYGCSALNRIESGTSTNPSEIEIIGKSAFENCTRLESNDAVQNRRLLFPNTDTVGERAFYGCHMLSTIRIVDSLTDVGEQAFANCIGLEEVYYGNSPSLTTLPNNLFKGCSSLQNFRFAESITTIEGNPFSDCNNLGGFTVDSENEYFEVEDNQGINVLYNKTGQRTIVLFPSGVSAEFQIPADVEKVAPYAFYTSRITGLTFDEGQTLEIGDYAFADNSSMLELIINDRVKDIGNYAFNNCRDLASITIDPGDDNENTLTIGEYAFANNNITDIVIPERVTIIGKHAFYGSYNLSEIEFSQTEEEAEPLIIDDYAFYESSQITELVFPSRLIEINDFAFSWCVGLEDIVFTPGELELTLGSYVFDNCHLLQEIELPNRLVEMGSHIFVNCYNLETVEFQSLDSQIYPEDGVEMGAHMFDGSNELRTVIIPAHFIKIGDYAFYGCENIENLIFIEGDLNLTIGKYAFSKSSSIEKFTIPARTTYIDNYAFYQSGLGNPALNTTKDGMDIIAYQQDLIFEEGDFEEGDKELIIGEYSFADTNLFYVKIPQRVTSILSYAFKDNKNLMLFEFAEGSSCNYIGEGAFENIGYATLKNSTQTYDELNGYDRFAYDDDLRKITLPDSVEELAEFVFRNSTSLREINLNEGLVTISEGAFYGCDGLSFISVPSTVEYIGNYAFYGCKNMQNIEILITDAYTLGSYSFAGCTSLTSLSLNMVSMIGDAPAYGCDSLEHLNVDDLNPNYKTINNVLYTKDVQYGDEQVYGEDELLVLYPAGRQGSTFSISRKTIELGSKAFSGNNHLKSITIDVDEEGSSVLVIDEDTFEDTSSQLEFFVGGNMEYVYRQNVMWRPYTERIRSSAISVENFIIEPLPGDSDSCRITKYIGLAEAGDNLVIPSTLRGLKVKEIGKNAFSHNAILRVVRIPQGVTKIAEHAFYNSVSLERLIISDSVQQIGEYAFYGCSSLTDVEIGNNSLLTTISNYAFQNCLSLERIDLPWRLRTIGIYAFAGNKDNHMSLKDINFAEGSLLESIGSYSFQYCVEMNTINLPDSVKNLGVRLFNHCKSLTSVIVERGVNQTLTKLQNENVFANTPQELMIYVYDNIRHEYVKARYWRDFSQKIGTIESLRDMYSTQIIQKEYSAINIKKYLGVYNPETYQYDDLEDELDMPEVFDKKSLGYADYSEETYTTYINGNELNIDFKSYNNLSTRTIIVYDSLDRAHSIEVEDVTFVVEGIRILKYLGAENDIVVPEDLQGLPVLEIDSYSFNYKLNSITLPEGLLEIRENAFRYSTSLQAVNIPLSLIKIGEGAFYNTSLMEINFSNNTTSALNSSRLLEIGDYAFYSNTSLTQVIIPPLVDRIGDYAFATEGEERMQLESIEFLGDEMSEIGSFAFAKTNIQTIILPEKLDIIKDGVFKDCVYLVSVYFNDDSDTSRIINLESNSSRLFDNCDFVKVYVTDNKLSYYRDDESWNRYASRILSWDSDHDGFVISVIDSTDMLAEIVHYLGDDEDVVIPSHISGFEIISIGTYVFDYTIKSVTIPNTVKTIRNNAFYKSSISEVIFKQDSTLNMIEQYAFYGTNLESVTIPETVSSIREYAFANTEISDIEFESESIVPDEFNEMETLTLADYSFSSNKNLQILNLPARLNQIQEYVFYDNTNLAEVNFASDGVLNVIESFAFSDCIALTEVVIPYSVQALYDGVFSGCSGLSEIYIMRGRDSSSSPSVTLTTAGLEVFKNVNNPYLKIYVPKNSLDEYRSMENWRVYAGTNEGGVPDPLVYPDFIIPDLITGDYAYSIVDSDNIQLNKYRGDDIHLEIPAQMEIGGTVYNVKAIGRHFGNPYIKSVKLYAGYEQEINMFAFSDSISLEEVVLPDTIEVIGEYAFRNCHNLRSINIPTEILEIKEGVFERCSSLKEIVIPESVQFIRAFAFNGCSSLYRVHLNRDEIEGGSSMFMNTPSAMRVFVDDVYLDSYKSKTLWAEMASQIIPVATIYGSFAIEELQNQTIKILQYTGHSEVIYIPEFIQGKRVVQIEDNAIIESVQTVYIDEGSQIQYQSDIADKVVYI